MRSTGSSLRTPFRILAIFATLLIIVLSQTDLGNWLRKSDYAPWSQNIEAELTAQKAELLTVDFGTLPEDDEELYVVVEIAEPQHDYEFERLFADLQQIVVQTYLQTDRAPERPDSIATLVTMEGGLRMGVIGPFESAMDYAQGRVNYDSWVDTWEFGFDVSEDFDVEE